MVVALVFKSNLVNEIDNFYEAESVSISFYFCLSESDVMLIVFVFI